MSTINYNIFLLFLVVIIGFLTKQFKLVPENTSDVLTGVLLNVTLPATVFVSVVTGLQVELLNQGLLILSLAALYFLLVIISILLFLKFIPATGDRGRVFAFAAIFPNTSLIGFPTAYFILGEQGIFLAASFDLIQTLVIFTFGAWMLNKNSALISRHSLQHLWEPPIIALFLGLLILISGLSIPKWLVEPLKLIGDTTTALAMLTIGQYLNLNYLKDYTKFKKLVPLAVLKLLLIPGLFILSNRLFQLPQPVAIVTLIMLASPTAILTSVFAKRYNSDYEFATLSVIVTTGFSILTIPFLMLLL